MYFHRANKVKSSQPTCLDGIRKATEILECTICNPNVRLTIGSNAATKVEPSTPHSSLLDRPPIRKPAPAIDLPLTAYTDHEANRLLFAIGKDRKLLIDLYRDKQTLAGWSRSLFLVVVVHPLERTTRVQRLEQGEGRSSPGDRHR